MQLSIGVMEFFYNLLPGTYFFLYLNTLFSDKFFKKNINSFTTNEWIITVFLGLLIGFMFQGVTKVFRLILLDKSVLNDLGKDKDKKAIIFKALKRLPLKNKVLGVEEIYLMDNYLNIKKTNILPTYFSARTSLWSNLVWANLFLFLVVSIKNRCINEVSLIFLTLAAFSFLLFYLNLRSQFDTIIKSFLMSRNS